MIVTRVTDMGAEGGEREGVSTPPGKILEDRKPSRQTIGVGGGEILIGFFAKFKFLFSSSVRKSKFSSKQILRFG